MTGKLPPLPFGMGSNWLRNAARDLAEEAGEKIQCDACGDTVAYTSCADPELIQYLKDLADAYDR